MIDAIFDIAVSFDYITPAMQLVQVATGMDLLTVTYSNDYTGRQVLNLLQKHGIETGAASMHNDELYVPVNDINGARQILRARGMVTE